MSIHDRDVIELEIDRIVAELGVSEERFREASPARRDEVERGMLAAESRLVDALARARDQLEAGGELAARSRRTYFLAVLAISRSRSVRERARR